VGRLVRFLSLSVLAYAAPAVGAEPWPPSTPPRLESSPSVAPAPPSSVAAGSQSIAPPPPQAEAELARVEPVTVPTEAVEIVTAAPPSTLEDEGALIGSRDGQVFVRTRHDGLVFLPVARLELDGRTIATDEQNASQSTLSLGRARLDLAGWVGPAVYFDFAADFAHGPSWRHADELVAVSPWGERAIVQLGQFDAPFSLENRTPDRYLDFGDRGAAVRFAIPDNKDQGLMVHGTNPARNFYYSAALLNGEGPRVEGVDGRFDFMARGWVAPFSFRDPEVLRDVRIGGSAWTGERSFGAKSSSFAAQTTAAGYTVLDPTMWSQTGAARPLELRQEGRIEAFGLELDAPFAHRFGARFEWIWKRQPLAAVDVTNAAHPARIGGLTLSGFGTYLELWGWVLGDDRILGAPAAPGLGLPVRWRELSAEGRPHGGLMVAARLDRVDQDVTGDASLGSAGLGVASLGTTKLTALTLGATYWYSRRARLVLDYVFNHLEGTAPYAAGLDAKNEHEILLRTALAL
jgi:hypothetical protein